MTDINDRYIERYRRRLADLDAIEQETRIVRDRYDQELSEVSSRRMRITNEIAEMRRIITTMIDHGCDPVEAKLRNQDSAISIWSNPTGEKWDTTVSLDTGYSITLSDLTISSAVDTMSASDDYDDGNGITLSNGYSYR